MINNEDPDRSVETPPPGVPDAAQMATSVRQATYTAGVQVFVILRFLLATLLLVAAGLKAHELIQGVPIPARAGGLPSGKFFQTIVVEFEFLLSVWLIAGAYSRWLWRVTLVCFALFAATALYSVFLGATSCGCFGRVQINPGWTLLLDVSVCAALVLFRPRSSDSDPRDCRRLIIAGAVWLLVGAPAALVIARSQPPAPSGPDDLLGVGSFVVLEPETWIGKPFPLAPHVDIGGELMSGQWIVVLYRYDCNHCLEEIPKYEQLAREGASNADSAKVALVSMPPHAPPDQKIISADTACARGNLNDAREWFVETPCEIILKDGVVIAHRSAAAGTRKDIEQ